MRNIDERLQRAQQQEGARQEDVQSGRIRVEPPGRKDSEAPAKQKANK
ncbi:MAG: hypothetical protein ACRDFW_13915 [bacterium]